MQISHYTFFFDVDNREFYVYSTLSNALLELDKISYKILRDAQQERRKISADQLEQETYDVLILKKFIIENDLDNFLFYKSIIEQQRVDKSYMHLTLAPTMDCCFNCHYCFEKYKGKNYMPELVMNSIIKYLNSLNSKPEFRLTWFGGEPLMALSQMEQFYDKLIAGYKKPIKSNIVTTGFHINENVVRIMQKIGVDQVQITLDGLKETHNKVKVTVGCEDVFSKVLDNIELLLNISTIHVIIRVNLTKQNAHEYVELYNSLVKRFKRFKHYGISPAFVMDRGSCNVSQAKETLFFMPDEIAEFTLGLYDNHNIHSPFLHYPSRFFNECAIRNIMSVSFDPEGYAYKCWEVIGNKEYAIGKLNCEGKMENINPIILNRQLYGADPIDDAICSICKYLPICNGGCPIQRIENVFSEKKNCYCTIYKDKMAKFLKTHLILRAAGFENK